MSNTKVPVLGPDVSRLTNEQIEAWYSKHPNATVRSLVARITWIQEQHKQELTAAYAAGFKAHADRKPSIADLDYRLSRLSPEEREYLEA